MKEAYGSIGKGAIFSEFFLMGIATLGAFGIGQYADALSAKQPEHRSVPNAKCSCAELGNRPHARVVNKYPLVTLDYGCDVAQIY